ncbi:MAG: response regulator transcription factor [Thermoleophilia bacterium]|nr:response regulator transcription factor [Thermoleophilia bacterium]
MRILIVEDNIVFREALELLLALQPDTDVVAAVGDGDAAVEACRAHAPEVIVMDYRLPGRDGVEVTAAVREECPEAAVVCLTAAISAAEERAIRDAGAVACVKKDQPLDEIVGAIRAAAGGAGRA